MSKVHCNDSNTQRVIQVLYVSEEDVRWASAV